jgi:hypothetical protein
MTGAEAIAVGRRLVASIEAAMMLTDPVHQPFELLALRAEREEALRLLARTKQRVEAVRRAGAVQGTRLRARWPQANVRANFGGFGGVRW